MGLGKTSYPNKIQALDLQLLISSHAVSADSRDDAQVPAAVFKGPHAERRMLTEAAAVPINTPERISC
jgi:hypothetical protein